MKKVLVVTGLFLGICTFSIAQQTKPAKKEAPAKTEQATPSTTTAPEKKTTHVAKHHKKTHSKKEEKKG